MSTDLASRITGLAADIEQRLAEDEKAAAALDGERWTANTDIGAECNYGVVEGAGQVARCGVEYLEDGELRAAHIARHDPARVLRQVKATRVLVDAILAEPHDYNPCDEYYSCSQAVDPDPAPGEGSPGSGCTDPDRAGQPCDCGRDQRAERLLRIIASQWDECPA